MKRTTNLLLLMLLLLSLPTSAQLPKPDRVTVGIDNTTVSKALDKAYYAITEGLRDPDSAKFRCVSVGRSEDETLLFVRGGINATNASGGYSGYKAFIVAFYLPDLTIRNASILNSSDRLACDR